MSTEERGGVMSARLTLIGDKTLMLIRKRHRGHVLNQCETCLVLVELADAVAAITDEREKCAETADCHRFLDGHEIDGEYHACGVDEDCWRHIAKAIRARKEP